VGAESEQAAAACLFTRVRGPDDGHGLDLLQRTGGGAAASGVAGAACKASGRSVTAICRLRATSTARSMGLQLAHVAGPPVDRSRR